MKILILQLARLGDVYMSWPLIRALKRLNPNAEIQLMVRPRFKAACIGLREVSKIHELPTQSILSPLIVENDLEQTMNKVDEFIETLLNEKFDQIVNLSFSPVSSYITKFLTQNNTRVSGYTLHPDGYLHLPDDVSRYFWAQVGPGFPNRIHVVDLLAGVAGVDLAPQDFASPDIEIKRPIEEKYFVLHIGASEAHKQVPAAKWAGIIREFQKLNAQIKWALIGAQNETEKAREIESLAAGQVINRVGQTQLTEIFSYLKFSEGLIGGDSAPMHMVPFVDQKAFCVSTGNVNFWETGPITFGSSVLCLNEATEMSDSKIAAMIQYWHEERELSGEKNFYKAVEGMPRYTNNDSVAPFSWELLKAIYMGAEFPITSDFMFYKACVRLFEANQVSIENLKKRNHLKKEFLTAVLDRVDEIFMAVTGEVPSILPFFRWYQAEKTRIQPGTFDQIAQDTLIIHEVFHGLLKKYLLEEDIRKVENHGNL